MLSAPKNLELQWYIAYNVLKSNVPTTWRFQMKRPKLVVGHLMNDQLLVKSVTTPKHSDWLKWLEIEELVEFFGELLKLMRQI